MRLFWPKVALHVLELLWEHNSNIKACCFLNLVGGQRFSYSVMGGGGFFPIYT